MTSHFRVREGGSNSDDKYNTLILTMEPTSTDYENLEEQIPSPNMTIECFQFRGVPDYDLQQEALQFVALIQKICNKFDSMKRIEIIFGSIPLVALSTILMEAKKLEELEFNGVLFVTGSTSLLDSLQQISNKSVKRCLIDGAWVDTCRDDNNDDGTICLPPTKLAACLLGACPNLEDLHVEDEDNNDSDEYNEMTHWNDFYSRIQSQHLKRLLVDVGTSCSAFLTTLSKLKAGNSLREVEIHARTGNDCGALEKFLRKNQGDNHRVTKFGITFYCLDDEEEFDFSLIAKALRYNRKLTTFRFQAVGGLRFFDDQYAEALATSILHNPKLTSVESEYMDEDSDHVKNIEMYLAINRHKGLVLEEGNTTATKLLWIHMLGVYGDNLSYLYHLLQQNPNICNLNNNNNNNNNGDHDPKPSSRKRRKICSISSPASKQQPSDDDCSAGTRKKQTISQVS